MLARQVGKGSVNCGHFVIKVGSIPQFGTFQLAPLAKDA
jgi:hypothetical protein